MNDHKPKVSVITPTYNTTETVLRESIESILSQTYKDFEYIILNDSPENLEIDRVVMSYDDPRIKYIKNIKNLGLEASTNKLIKMASGEYIAIFDHDDISLPQRLEEEVSFLDDNKEMGAVSGQFEVFGNESWTSKNPLLSEEINQQLEQSSCVSHSALMIRKSILIDNNLKYEKKFFPASSYRLITRIALISNISNLPTVLLRYRLDGKNTSTNNIDLRVKKRNLIQEEFKIEKGKNQIKNLFSFDTIELLNRPPFKDHRRYYKARRDEDMFFIKEDNKDFRNEFEVTSRMYKKSKKYFIEPITEYQSETVNYLIMRWTDGIELNEYLKDKRIISKEKKDFIKDIYKISHYLRDEGVIHRDLIPRNFLVVDNGLKLIDFYYAVYFEKYQESDYIKSNISDIDRLGEEFAKGRYIWDDDFSLLKIIEYILDKEKNIDLETIEIINKIKNNINTRTVTPNVQVFADSIDSQVAQMKTIEKEHLNNKKEIEKLTQVVLDKNEHIKALNTQIENIIKSRSWCIARTLSYLNYKKSIPKLKAYIMKRRHKEKPLIREHEENINKKCNLAVIVHLFYPEMWNQISKSLKNINVPFDLYITGVDNDEMISKVSEYHEDTSIIKTQNQGRDVVPFLLVINKIAETNKYEYILKIHSKKSKHRKDGNLWFKEILEELLPRNTNNILEMLKNKETGLIGPKKQIVSLSVYMGDNREHVYKITKKLFNKNIADETFKNLEYFPFFGGTMFWGRIDYFNPILKLRLNPTDFEAEKGQVDGTMAHAIERVLGRIMHKWQNKNMYCVDKKGVIKRIDEEPYNKPYKYVG